jgi:serine/threonine-protein kinase
MGTPSYMAPEQIESAKGVDARADVFSLGSILFELVAGRRPFQADSTLHLLNAVAEGDRPHVREVVPDLPDRMVHAIEGALQVPLEQRVESCRKLLEIWSDGTVLPEVANPVWDEELVSTLSHQDDWVPPETSEAPATYGLPSSRFTHPSITSPPAPPPKPRPYLAGALFVLGLAILATTLVYALRPQPSIESPAVTVGLISVEQAPAAEPKPEPVVAPTPSIAPKVDPVPEVERADDPSQPFHTFTSTPSGAVVYLDGLLVGTTPLQDFRVPRGRHRIRLVADQAEAERKLSVTRRSERHLHWDRETDVWTTPED